MRIGFDISQTGRFKAGCGHYADSLVQHLASADGRNRYELYPTFGSTYWDPDWDESTCRVDLPNFQRHGGQRHPEETKRFWGNDDGLLESRLRHPDILHANNFSCPLGLRRTRLVYTVYDLSFLEHPELTSEINRTNCFNGLFDASVYADHIVCISEYSRDHFLATFPNYPGSRVSVARLASRFSNTGIARRPNPLPAIKSGRYWLNVGTLEPRKNQRRLLDAYATIRRNNPEEDFSLVFAGGDGWLMEDFRRAVEQSDLKDDVFFLGYVDETTLQWLYENCFALVYPSLFEGFGLPVLEAMSLGAAVIASNTTSMPEIVGDAGILVDPRSEDAIREAMLDLARSPERCREFRQRARSRAERFSWDGTAAVVLQCYANVMQTPRFARAVTATDRVARFCELSAPLRRLAKRGLHLWRRGGLPS